MREENLPIELVSSILLQTTSGEEEREKEGEEEEEGEEDEVEEDELGHEHTIYRYQIEVRNHDSYAVRGTNLITQLASSNNISLNQFNSILF